MTEIKILATGSDFLKQGVRANASVTEEVMKNVADELHILEYVISNDAENFLKLLFATSFIYILGMVWLGSLIGWDKPIFELGAKPFLLAELFKILIALFAINQIKKIKRFI